MNRETKIGLLVGLAFIIVVAILLTDHTTTTTDPRPAALPDVANNVRASVQTPAPAADTSHQKVPTRADLANTPPESVKSPIKIGGPTAPEAPIAVGSPASTDPASQLPEMKPVNPRTNRPDLVSQHPDELTRVGGPSTPPGKPTAPVIAPKTYVAEAGDSVNRIAARNMAGGSTRANREALIKANPTMQAEGNPVVIGKTYIIPSVGAVAQITEPAKREAAKEPAVPSFVKPVNTPTNVTWYTVKENDNLWRIAASELGDGNRWQQIKDLNKDLLKGGATVKANQRIRLPRGSASTASVN